MSHTMTLHIDELAPDFEAETTLLVRPDGHVAWRVAADDARGLSEA